MKDLKHIKRFNESIENLNIESIYAIFEDRFKELDVQMKQYGDRFTSIELDLHLEKERECGLLYKRIKDKYSLLK